MTSKTLDYNQIRNRIKERTKELGIAPDHDEFGHYYQMNGKRYPSVTGRLKLLKDDSLANWKMNQALEFIREHHKRYQLEDLLSLAAEAPVKTFKNAGNIGQQVHSIREEAFRKWIDTDLFHPMDIHQGLDPAVVSGARAIHKFLHETKYQPIAVELYLADDSLEIGGSLDDVGVIDGKLGILDLKTSNQGDKEAYYYQVALYVAMFEKLYKIKTHWHKILHVSKTDGTYNLIDIPDIRTRIKEAKHIVKVDRFLEELKKSKKKQPIII